MQQYVGLLQKLNTQIGQSAWPLNFSATIHWKLNEWAEAGKLPSGATSNLAVYVDMLVPMVYVTTKGSTIHRRSKDEATHVPILVGLRFSDYKDVTVLENMYEDLNNRFVGEPNFRGTSVFKLATLMGWEE